MSQIAAPGYRRRADPGAHRAVRRPARRGQLPVVGVVGGVDQARACRSRSASPTGTSAARSARDCGSCCGNRLLRAITMCTGIGNFFTAMIFAVFYVLLARNLHLSAGRHRRVQRDGGGRRPARVAARVADRAGSRAGADHLDLRGRVRRADASSSRSCTATGRSPCWSSRSSSFWAAGVVYNITQVSFRQAPVPAAAARPDERDDPVHRVGHDAARRVPRRRPRLDDRRARHDAGRARSAASFTPLAVFFSPLRHMRELPTDVPDVETANSLAETAG